MCVFVLVFNILHSFEYLWVVVSYWYGIYFAFIDCLFRFQLGNVDGVKLMYVCMCVVEWTKKLLKLQLLAANHGKLVRELFVVCSVRGKLFFTSATFKTTVAILFNFIPSEICFLLFRFHLILVMSMLLCMYFHSFFFFWFLDQYYALFTFFFFLKFNQYRLNLITIRGVWKKETLKCKTLEFSSVFSYKFHLRFHVWVFVIYFIQSNWKRECKKS